VTMIEIRSCEGMEEFEACVQLQFEIWGYDETDAIPRKTFLLAAKIGGQVIGAFDSAIHGDAPKLVGFAMSLPGIKTLGSRATPYLHSHMLAVRDGYQNRGIGAQLKLEQRREALSRGIRHMEWTFDPLEIKNAFLNIHRLGAVVRSYRENFYGVSSSRLQGGLPTDRLVAEWALDSVRVEAHLAGRARRPAAEAAIVERIEVSAAVGHWKKNAGERDRALALQQQNRERFIQAFARGLAVTGFTRDAEGNGIFELGPITEAEFSPTSEAS
jgi:predicted GNAT superfamily acetyltransferase